ncbi:uncharacterized protein LOC106881947 [Octopus bimaculoides]|uniref:uncharacterized protein LOC106881947 n=1 Tax=Octopus bimaculoides TaxID=37653 RepID=UPI00071CE8B1|nr:uncharacterized protein LOC106881947 [Octopus bimaculoides]|eukprot:XP_014787964.1 PREDICTED: uncharacterized protein LOC106881947 [Octopus bimaculoides]
MSLSMQVHLRNFHLCQNFCCSTGSTDELYPGQTPADRPGLTDRVFNTKLRDLLHDILEKNVLAEIAGYMWTIKHGLPHFHMLFILKKIQNIMIILFMQIFQIHKHNQFCFNMSPKACYMVHVEEINPMQHVWLIGNVKNISLETFRKIRYTVLMAIHFTDVKIMVLHFTKSNVELDNRSVVPYSPFFLVKYGGHCNVEIRASVKSVKYISKYIHKSHNRVTVNISGQTNAQQIHKNYINGHYTSSSEAVWRILGFKLHGSYPAVKRLTVHLSQQQYIYLMTIMVLNMLSIHMTDPLSLNGCELTGNHQLICSTLHHTDFPEFFTWNNSGISEKLIHTQLGLSTLFH